MRRYGVILTGFVFLMSSSQALWAQSTEAIAYPSRLVRIVTPIAAGSAADFLARMIADKLQQSWNQSVIVENRPGPVGTQAVAQSPPDGYTLLLMSNGHVIANIINKNVSFDPIKDFAGVTKVATVPQVLVTTPTLPARTLKDLIALEKESPGRLNYGSAGLGSISFLAAELFKKVSNTRFTHVPYSGGGAVLMDVVRGETQIYFIPVNVGLEFIEGGKMNGIAITSSQRSPVLPTVPTFAEAGLPDFRFDAWFGVMSPANTPRPIVEKINADIGKVLQLPDVVKALSTQGFVISTDTPIEFDALMKSDAKLYGDLLNAINVGAK
jgi:tripartite-type tricarboxylate transporter receptor subunit TctC